VITDTTILAQIVTEWDMVKERKDFIADNLAAGHTGIGSIGVSYQFKNLAYSLWLPFGFSIFERALVQLRDESVFVSKKSNLEALMVKSRTTLPWQDYALVDEARNRRNDVAHRRLVLERDDAWRFVDAIERELRAWRIVT
jgi:hypothetical protein